MRWNLRVIFLASVCALLVFVFVSLGLFSSSRTLSSLPSEQFGHAPFYRDCPTPVAAGRAEDLRQGKAKANKGASPLRPGSQLLNEPASDDNNQNPAVEEELLSALSSAKFAAANDAADEGRHDADAALRTQRRGERDEDEYGEAKRPVLNDIPCLINGGERKFTCLRDAKDEVYLPFKAFIAKYFEVYGSVVKAADGEEQFEWWHSYAKITRPNEPYNPRGVFGPFSTYNVENRDRMKCLSGKEGVPLSVQWGPNPYYYPIQIAQFALEHYSKNLTEESPLVEKIDDGGVNDARDGSAGVLSMKRIWRIPPDYTQTTTIAYKYDMKRATNVIYISADESLDNPGVFVQLNQDQKLRVLQFDIALLSSNASFTLTVERLDTNEFFDLHYVQSDEHLRTVKKGFQEGGAIFYGLGAAVSSSASLADENVRSKRSIYATGLRQQLEQKQPAVHPDEDNGGANNDPSATPQWRRITRNANTDVIKGLAAMSGKKKFRLLPENFRLVSLAFRGQVLLDNLTVDTSAHLRQFLDAADWLLLNQDARGGWPIPVARTLADKRLTLAPNWYSAMAQGHAMSALCRAYALTNERHYLDAALRATALFDVPASEGGVLNKLFGRYAWYEEYPTVPGTFVLNGFIYALIGLYDLRTASNDSAAARLYDVGLASLTQLLPLFDTGSGSVYDLRHISLLSAVSPNIARWDYHSVHIYQLLWLQSIERQQSILGETAERWIKYAKGEKAKHN